MKTRTRFHLLFLEIATITRFVAISLAVFSPDCFKEPVRLSGFIINCVGAALLAICFILIFPLKIRNNIPPYVYLFLVFTSGLCAIAESSLYGVTGFKKIEVTHHGVADLKNNTTTVHGTAGVEEDEITVHGAASVEKNETASHREQIYIAAMAYVITSFVSSLALFIALIVWPPVYKRNTPDKQDVEEQYSSRRPLRRSYKEQEESERSKKQKSPESNRSRRGSSQKSNRSRRGSSQNSNRSRRGDSQRGDSQKSNRSQRKLDL